MTLCPGCFLIVTPPSAKNCCVSYMMQDPHIPVPPHSCKHCKRLVLRKKHFRRPLCRIELPHTTAEIEQAIADRCNLIQLTLDFTMKARRNQLSYREAVELLASPIEYRDREVVHNLLSLAGVDHDDQGLFSISASANHQTLSIRRLKPDEIGDPDWHIMYVRGVKGKRNT